MTCARCGATLAPGSGLCTVCGTPVAAAPQADPTQVAPGWGAPPADPTGTYAVPGAAPYAPPPAPGTAGRRPPVRLLGGLVGVVLLGVVAFMVLRATGGGSGGAESPEAAVRQLVTAIEARDTSAMLDVFLPGELQAAADLVADVEARADEEGLGGEGGLYDGLELTVEDLELDVEELGPDGAKVTIEDGTIGYSIERDRLSPTVADATADLDTSGELDLGDLGWESDWVADEVEPFVVVVRDGGGWYVSAYATAAQYGAEFKGYDDGEFDPAAEEDDESELVAENPEDLVEAIVEALDDADDEALVRLLSAEELGVLAAYRDAIDDLRDEIEADEGPLDDLFSVDIDDVDVEVEMIDDDTARLIPDDISGTVTWIDEDDGVEETAAVRIDDECIRVDDDEECIPDEFADQTGISRISVIVVREDGMWRLSPMRTALDHATTLLETVTFEAVLRAFDARHLAEPTAALELGESTDVETNAAGFAVLTAEVEAGAAYLVTARPDAGDDYLDLDVRPPPGDDDSWCRYVWDGDSAELCVIVPAEAGTLRVVVESEAWQSVPATVSVEQLDAQPAAVPGTLDGGDDGAAYLVEAQSGTWYVEYSGSGEPIAFGGDGGSVGFSVYDNDGTTIDEPMIVYVPADTTFEISDQSPGSALLGGLPFDEFLTPIAEACAGGDMAECDRLWDSTPVGSPFEDFAETCGGRAPEGGYTSDCVEAFG